MLRRFIQENRDLENFRFLYGIKVENAASIRRLKPWLDRHNIGIGRLQKIRKWVDIHSKNIVVEPTKKNGNGEIVCLTLWYAIFFLATQAFGINDAFLQFRQSGTWFRTDGNTIRDLLDRTEVELKLCATDQEKIAREMDFSQPEVSAICKDYSKQSFEKLVREGRRAQRILTGGVSAVALWLAILSILRLKAMGEARKLCKQIRARVLERKTASKHGAGKQDAHAPLDGRAIVEAQ